MKLPSKEKRAVTPIGDAENLHQEACGTERSSAFKNLGILDRFLAIWILLAMVIGILLGNFVPETGPALQRGKFVGVSVPIGSRGPVPLYPFLC
jgi:arsenite transporter